MRDRIGPCGVISLRPPQGLFHAPSGDQRFHAGDDDKSSSALAVLTGLDLSGKFLDIRQRLPLFAQKAIGFRKELVFDANARDIALFQLPDQAPHVVEIPVAGVGIEQDWDDASRRS